MARVRKPSSFRNGGSESGESKPQGNPVGATDPIPAGVTFTAEPDDSGPDSADSGDRDSPRSFDPATVSSTGTGDSGDGTGKRRGRRPGSRNKPTGKDAEKSKDALAGIIAAVHEVGAKITKVPELELSKEECIQLADAMMNVARFYDIPVLAEKTVAWVSLGMVAFSIYAPRVTARSINTKKKTVEAVRPIRITEVPSAG